ncbi:MAG TPA: hypothetical protein VGO61_03410 [Steroidobacteraceae bacterium]|jgi:hypothetical protein|nr:hypothetical protein [Steroidobacteraceae bacterium]
MRNFGLILVLAIASAAFAAPPASPHLTVHATDIRQLEFNYEPVPGVATYELWFRAAPGAQWVKYQEHVAQRGPLFRIAVSVHLLDWRQARYYVAACNPSGCTPSNQVGVDGEQLAAIGYIKPSAATGHHWFGSNVAASADGKTIAVLSSEDIGAQSLSATVHVYRKTTATSGWRREARLLPSTIGPATGQPFQGDQLAISGDGNLLVLATWTEDSAAQYPVDEVGAVYLFRRAGTTWRLAQKLTGLGDTAEDWFGFMVKVDDAGRTLVISHSFANYSHEAGYYLSGPGTLEIYRDPDDASDQFVHSATVQTPFAAGYLGRCDAIALSGDGNTLLRGCSESGTANSFVQVLNGPGFIESARLPGGTTDGVDVSYDGTLAVVQVDDGGAAAWKRAPSGWVRDGFLTGIDGAGPGGHRHIAISRDGKIAALGNSAEFTLGLGPVYPPYQAGDDEFGGTGGVIVHEHKSSGWVVRRLVKPGSGNAGWAGHSVALGDNGRLLVVGAPMDASAATGIDGYRQDASVPERGAVWVY